MRALSHLVCVFAVFDRGQYLRGPLHGRRIESLHLGAFLNEKVDDLERGGFSEIVSVGLECEPEHTDAPIFKRAKDFAELDQHTPTGIMIDVHDGAEKLWMASMHRGHMRQCGDVLRKTGATIPYARLEERWPNALVQAHPPSNLF